MEIDVGRARQGRLEIGRFAPLQGLHGFLKHAVVKIEPHLRDFARLVFAEHFAGTSDFQVVHREVEAASEVFEGLNRFEGCWRPAS